APDGEGPLAVCSSGAYVDEAQASRVRSLVAGGGILCALRSPYDATIAPDRPALLTYGDVPASMNALAAVLAGDAPPRGTLPVKLG
ncbi:MAG: beta-N-acetylhexosaminidase, partial [Candidatus Limnocylindria bacterium]